MCLCTRFHYYLRFNHDFTNVNNAFDEKLRAIPGVAFQTGNTSGLFSITPTISGSTVSYAFKDEKTPTKWYGSYNCGGTIYQFTNDSEYSVMNKVLVSDVSSDSFNRYRTVALVLNITSKTLSFKLTTDAAADDYCLQIYLGDRNVTPFYAPDFITSNKSTSATDTGLASPRVPADAAAVGRFLTWPSNSFVQGNRSEGAVIQINSTISGTDVVYTMEDIGVGLWYLSFVAGGLPYQITNDDEYSATRLVLFAGDSISAKTYNYVCVAIDKAALTISLKLSTELTVNDAVLAVFFRGKNVTPYSTPCVSNIRYDDQTLLDEAQKDYLKRGLYKIFKKVGCIGDSWTAGYIRTTGGVVYGSSPDYAWPFYMNSTGIEWVNGGYSGASAHTYLLGTTPSNGPGYQAIEAAGMCQAYMIGLGINDSNTTLESHIPLGTASDILDDTKNTFYSWYSRIVAWALNLNPDAFAFCMTMYPGLSGAVDLTDRYAPYNTAIRDIVAYFQSEEGEDNERVRLLELADRDDLFAAFGRDYDISNNHHGCVGWEMISECLKVVLGDEIVANPNLYHDVRNIPKT